MVFVKTTQFWWYSTKAATDHVHMNKRGSAEVKLYIKIEIWILGNFNVSENIFIFQPLKSEKTNILSLRAVQ